MNMLLYLEHLVLCLQIHTDRDIQSLVFVSQCLVISILDVTSCKLIPFVNINIFLHEIRIEVLYDKILTLQVYYRTFSTFLVYQHNWTNTGFLCDEGIISTEVRSDMYDTCTIVSGYIVARNHLEGIAHRFDGRHQLLIFHSNEVNTLVASYDTIRYQFLALLVFGQFTAIGDSTLSRQIGIQSCFCQYNSHFVCGVRVICLYGNIVNLRTYAECRVSCQCPWCCRPGKEIGCAPFL